jgi:gamma-glutamylcyclotransferase (GGCT)/AIG2-like uncharacterized protein YtfP
MKEAPKSNEQLPVFVYGTLRSGGKNYGAYLGGRTTRERPGTIRGELFFVADGGYPYVVAGDSAVRGEVMEIVPALYEETLKGLDELEEYDPQSEEKSLYLRRPAAVRLEDGTEVTAWTYYWNCPHIKGEKVQSGDFKKR